MEQLKKGVEVIPGFLCRLLREKDLPQVNQLMASNYSYQHPGRQVFKVTKEDIGDYDVQKVKESLKGGASLCTFMKKTGQLIAFEINTIHDVTEGDTNFTQPTSKRFSARQRFVKRSIGDVFSDLNTKRYMYGSMACVRSENRGLGVFSAIENLRIEMARENGCEYFVALATSRYSQRAAKSGGYKVLREVFYVDYVDPETGIKPDLNLSPIHTSIQLVYKRLQPDSLTKHNL